jgi:hypothetical protein
MFTRPLENKMRISVELAIAMANKEILCYHRRNSNKMEQKLRLI